MYTHTLKALGGNVYFVVLLLCIFVLVRLFRALLTD